jgi:pyruvate formate lyase activating enzyme
MEKKGIIFDIKKFAIHDGPGIRTTVFFKGCPLCCVWCHNPEGIHPQKEIMVYSGRCLKGCHDCFASCPKKALSKNKDIISLDRDLCDGCGICVQVCPAEALQLAGRMVTSDEIMAELDKDKPFYQDSGGGVTFSGGEPLQQPDFLLELLFQSRKRHFHTAVDTSGYAPSAVFSKIAPFCDLFLFDLKIIDDAKHKRLTGVSNRLILENLQLFSGSGSALAIRVPLIPGCNDAAFDLEQLAGFCAALPARHPVHLLPYHRGYSGKTKRLDRVAPLAAIRPPTAETVEKARKIFSKAKLTVKIGG